MRNTEQEYDSQITDAVKKHKEKIDKNNTDAVLQEAAGHGTLAAVTVMAPPTAVATAPIAVVLSKAIESDRNVIEKRIDKELYDKIVNILPSAPELKHELDPIKRLDTLQTMATLSHREDLPEQARNYVRELVTNVTLGEFRTLHSELEYSKLQAIGLTEKLSFDIHQLGAVSQKAANEIARLRSDVDAGKISAKKYAMDVMQKVNDVDRVVRESFAKSQTMFSNQQSHYARLQESTLNELSILLEQTIKLDSIKGMEHIPSIKKRYAEFEQLKSNKAPIKKIIHCKRQLQREIIDVRARQSAFIQSKNDLLQLSSTFSVVAQLSGNQPLANQVSVVGGSAVSLYENALGLFGSALVSPISPVTAAMNIIQIGENLMNVFGKKRSAADPLPMILNAIHQLSQQVTALRDEMHERFDEVLTKLSLQQRQVLDSFCLLAKEQILSLSVIRLAYLSTQKGIDEIHAGIRTLAADISDLKDIMVYQPIGNDRDVLVREKNVLIDYPIANYIQHANTIDSIGLDFSISHQPSSPLSVSQLGLTPDDYLHFPNYYARLFSTLIKTQMEIPLYGDLHLLVPAALTKALLDSKAFPQPDHKDPRKRMPRVTLNKLSMYMTMLENLADLMITLRAPEFIDAILTKAASVLLHAGHALDTVFREIISEETLRYEQALGLVLDQRRSELNHAAIRSDVKVDTNGWFEGENYRNYRLHPYKRKPWQYGSDATGKYDDKARKAKYIKSMTKQITTQKKQGLNVANQAHREVRSTTPPLFGEERASLLHGVRHIRPLDDTLPYLPAPEIILNTNKLPNFMQLALIAQSYRCGDIELVYEIKDNSTFLLYIEFASVDHNKTISIDRLATLSLPFDDLGFQPSEAVWYFWFGGNLPEDGIGKKVHEITGKHLFKWDHLVEKYSREELYSEICAIANNGGAYWHKSGEFEYNSVEYKKPNDFIQREGVYSLLQSLDFEQVDLPIGLSVDVDALSKLNTRLLERKSEFTMCCKNKFIAKLSSKTGITLGDARGELESSFRNIFGVLSFAYHDTLEADTPLRQWFSRHVMTVNDLKQHYRSSSSLKTPSQVLQQTYDGLPELKNIIADLRVNLTSNVDDKQSINCRFLTDAISRVDGLIVCNQPYVEGGPKALIMDIEQNSEIMKFLDLASYILNDKPNSKGLRLLEKQLNSIHDVIAGFPVEIRSHYKDKLQAWFLQKGLSVEWHAISEGGCRITKNLTKKRGCFLSTWCNFWGGANTQDESSTINKPDVEMPRAKL